MKFQEKLQVLRKEKGMSQEKLAEKIGVSRQAVAKWEAGRSYPEIDKLIMLSELFRISIDKFVKNADEENCSFDNSNKQDYLDEKIIEFLFRARRSTYAGGGAETAPSRPNSHDLQYIEDSLKYIDTYLGGEKFAGEEALWVDDFPFWSMNYNGRIIEDGFSGTFLKECLFLVTKEYPFRGPLVYQKGEYKYHCIVNGKFEWFSGYEEIFCNDIKVYECVFQGGSVK